MKDGSAIDIVFPKLSPHKGHKVNLLRSSNTLRLEEGSLRQFSHDICSQKIRRCRQIGSFTVDRIYKDKIHLNRLFGPVLQQPPKSGAKNKCAKVRKKKRKKKRNSGCKEYGFLLKVDEVADPVIALLLNHQQNKDRCKAMQQGPRRYGLPRTLDRRLRCIEETLCCDIRFPGNLRPVRYKGVVCVRVLLSGSKHEVVVRAINHIRFDLPSLYEACIFPRPLPSLSTATAPNQTTEKSGQPICTNNCTGFQTRFKQYLINRPTV